MEPDEMDMQVLIDLARSLVAADKGLLAMDESNPTCPRPRRCAAHTGSCL
jgi:fructose-bisphosphate aldolase class 1